MRKVKFNRFIQDTYVREVSGTWEFDFQNEGMFLGFGPASKLEDGWPNTYTVALIELKDGTVEEVLPERIKFVNPSFIETKN